MTSGTMTLPVKSGIMSEATPMLATPTPLLTNRPESPGGRLMPDSTPSTDYRNFLARKAQLDGDHGFDPVWMPDCLFDFQRFLLEWSLRKGRAAIFSDCGTGKALMALVWAENVVRYTGKPVLILTPLAVAQQT